MLGPQSEYKGRALHGVVGPVHQSCPHERDAHSSCAHATMPPFLMSHTVGEEVVRGRQIKRTAPVPDLSLAAQACQIGLAY